MNLNAFEDRQGWLGHRSERITTHYSPAELERLKGTQLLQPHLAVTLDPRDDRASEDCHGINPVETPKFSHYHERDEWPRIGGDAS